MGKILLVDDSSTVRDTLGLVLRNAGFDVITAVDGKDGLTKAVDKDVKLIFCDVNMPNMDGLTMCEKLRQTDNKFVKVIMLTTESGEGVKARGKAAGVSGWITKPFKPEVIVDAAKKLVA